MHTRRVGPSCRVLFVCVAAQLVAWSRTASADDDTEVRFYGDASYSVFSSTSASSRASPDLFPSVSNSFDAAHFEIFPTASFDRLSFLAEVMFESDREANEFDIDVERIQAMYLFSDALRVKVGRVHTAFGYYNDTYHHARIFDLTTDRPYLTNFEDSGGIIPAHIVGAGIDGKWTLGAAGDFTYNLDVGNARLPDITAVPVALSAQGEKAANLRLRFLPTFLSGAIVGINAMYEDVPAGSVAGTGGALASVGSPDHLQETDLGVHLVLMHGGIHFILEGAYIRHYDFRTGGIFQNYGGFVEAGYSFGDFTPYARYEGFQFDSAGDPLFENGPFLLAGTGMLNDGRVGLKWLPNEHVALKVEGRFLKTDLGPGQATGTLQCAFGF
ncbi:MAG TPA: hypothetical protein VGM06_20280 [Polyangiaceae bacterium]|jgi:hypothetical protein